MPVCALPVCVYVFYYSIYTKPCGFSIAVETTEPKIAGKSFGSGCCVVKQRRRGAAMLDSVVSSNTHNKYAFYFSFIILVVTEKNRFFAILDLNLVT